VDVRIGVARTAKELEIELPDDADGEAVKAALADALKGDDEVLWLTDKRGRQVGIPADKIAYVEIGGEESRTIGFGA
jgi:hypothetical protein